MSYLARFNLTSVISSKLISSIRNLIILLVGCTASAVFLHSCSWDGPDDIPGTVQPCDTVDIAYNPDIKMIMEANCLTSTCHSGEPGAQNPRLTTYQEVFDRQDRILKRAVEGDPSFMPPSGPISLCSMDKIVAWINNGAPENP